MLELITSSEEETIAAGRDFGSKLPEQAIVCFSGDLGAGKTTFIRGMHEALLGQGNSSVSSPTFVFLQIYQGLRTIYHFDLYRLKDADQFLSMGFDEYFYSNGICCIEWSERITSLLPECLKVTMEHLGGNRRRIQITDHG